MANAFFMTAKVSTPGILQLQEEKTQWAQNFTAPSRGQS